MAKVAKLVYISLATRVVVDENATEDEIIQASRANFIDKIQVELGEYIEEIVNDTELPFGEIPDDFD